jgi:uncharacterized damage-inducible protein DinB
MVEPWLRGTLTEVDAVRRQVLHALEQTGEDVARWCSELTEEELEVRPFGLPSVGFQMRHIARSLDRLLTYAEGKGLSGAQMDALKSEMDTGARAAETLGEIRAGLDEARRRVLRILPDSYEAARGVGRAMLPSTVGGLLVHCAEHTQRHAGQMVTTAKVLLAIRAGSSLTQ